MKEYIEREAVLQFPIRKDHCDKEHANKHFIFGVESVMEYVENLPAADVAEVRHGSWIDLNIENSTGPIFMCSECSHIHNPNRSDLDLERVELKPLYCDACGARMDKEDEQDAD